MNIKNVLSFLLIFAVIGFGVFALQNRQNIQDWWYLRSYVPPAEIAQLSDQAGMNENGQNIFYLHDPTLNTKESFNVNCPFEEKTIVLGCYDGTNIYILEIDDQRIEGVKTVTAAHEMLHGAYDRLSTSEKQRINGLLQEQFDNSDNPRIKELIGEYDTGDQDLINNELHSILPTELEDLSPELEEYYKQYFSDRSKVVQKAKEYEAVFVEITESIDQTRAEINSLKNQISFFESQLNTLSSQITEQRDALDQLEAEDNIEQYNALVPGFNSLVREHNSVIAQLRIVVDHHNSLVEQVNQKLSNTIS